LQLRPLSSGHISAGLTSDARFSFETSDRFSQRFSLIRCVGFQGISILLNSSNASLHMARS
jgi:hypothetical protein